MNEETEIEIGANPIAEAIGAAEDIADPLDGLAEKCAADPGAAFTPEVLERLAELKKDDRAAFELLRSQLKKAGCRVTALDEAIAEESGDTGRGPTQADILIDIAQTAELFHAPDGTGFADLDINGHRETWPIRAKGFRRWLARRFFEATQGAPSSEALQSALNVIEAKAHFDAPERIVHVRVGGLDGRLYLDLGDEAWRAVEIDATGWRVAEAAAHRRGLNGTLASYRETVKVALVHLDATDQSERVVDAIRATASDTDDDIREMDEDEAMTRRALDLLGSRRNDRYEAALAALREDTRVWWADLLAGELGEPEEGEEPATADAEGLRRFLEAEVMPWFDGRKKELANRPLIREQAFGEALDPDKLERLGRYEVHLDRKLERMLSMLLRLKDLRAGAVPG